MSEEETGESNEANIIFRAGNPPEPVMILSKDGFIYKGKKIEDEGEAYSLFINWLKTASVEKT